jgi:hypothetical protein
MQWYYRQHWTSGVSIHMMCDVAADSRLFCTCVFLSYTHLLTVYYINIFANSLGTNVYCQHSFRWPSGPRTAHSAACRSIRPRPSTRPPTAAAVGTLTDRTTPAIATPKLSPPPRSGGALLTQISCSRLPLLLFINYLFRNKAKREVLWFFRS